MGLLVLLGVAREDTEADANYLAEKIAGLRIFEDENGKMNRSVRTSAAACWRSRSSRCTETCGGASVHRSTMRRHRSSRGSLYEMFVERIRAPGLRCETGRFQEMMQVELVNEGPVTILLDSTKVF